VKPLIHFAHGNGFPSPCYRQLLQCLQPQFDYCYIDKIGHSPEFPVTENWHTLVNEIIASVQRQTSQPAIALGHSLGGVLSFLAAIEQPELFKAVVLLDSPVIGRFKSNIIHMSKILGMIDHITPAFRTRGRKHNWQTRDEVLTYLRNKKLFRTFTQSCLEDYIDYGLQKNDNGYSLRFDRHIEYQIYRTIPHILHEYEGRLKIPAVIIYGNKSDVIDQSDLRYMNRHYELVVKQINGTHMFPMEDPQATASLIISTLNEMGVL